MSIMQRLPNFFTFMRLVLIPVFVYLMIKPTDAMMNWALAIFIIASLTDFIDGKLARHYNAVTDFGKLFDPIADKILVMSALVMLAAQAPDNNGFVLLPGWVVVLILARETWVTGLRSVAASKGVVIAANMSGKIKSAMQMIAIVLMLCRGFASLEINGYNLPLPLIGYYLLLLSIIVSYWGAVEYSLLVFDNKGNTK